MAPPPMPARKPVPPPSSPSPSALRPGWERDLTNRFRQHISTKRMNMLSQRKAVDPAQNLTSHDVSKEQQRAHLDQLPLRHGSGSQPAHSASSPDDFSLGAPTSHPALRNIPIMPTPPTRQSHQRFRNELHMLSETPCRWENPGLLDEALRLLPFERLCREAEDEANYFAAAAQSLRTGKKPAWAYQDCLIRQLMHWFAKEFFSFINVPKCGVCGGNTMPVDNGTGTGVLQVAPLPEERALSANKVELYRCPRADCGAATRFARYNDAFVLMREGMRRGRVGEWVNTFGMLCRALGSRVRWVWVLWNNDDHSWVEVYSEHRKRWIHVDPIEQKWDSPTMYTEGWGRKIRYCIAFSNDGASDVTSRYCRDTVKHAANRSKCTEAVLLYILDEICRLRRRNMEKAMKFKLEGEDSAESRELKHYYVHALISTIIKITPKTEAQRKADDADRRKAEERRSESIQRREQNQEGRTSPRHMAPPPPPPPQR